MFVSPNTFKQYIHIKNCSPPNCFLTGTVVLFTYLNMRHFKRKILLPDKRKMFIFEAGKNNLGSSNLEPGSVTFCLCRVGKQVEETLREVFDLSPAAAPSSLILPASHGMGLAFTLLLQVGQFFFLNKDQG